MNRSNLSGKNRKKSPKKHDRYKYLKTAWVILLILLIVLTGVLIFYSVNYYSEDNYREPEGVQYIEGRPICDTVPEELDGMLCVHVN